MGGGGEEQADVYITYRYFGKTIQRSIYSPEIMRMLVSSLRERVRIRCATDFDFESMFPVNFIVYNIYLFTYIYFTLK